MATEMRQSAHFRSIFCLLLSLSLSLSLSLCVCVCECVCMCVCFMCGVQLSDQVEQTETLEVRLAQLECACFVKVQ